MTDKTKTKASTTRSRLGNAVATGVASGLLTLVDPAKLRPSTRGALYVGTGASAGLVAWFGTAPGENTKPGKTFRAAVAIGLGTLSAAGTKLGFVIDARIHQALSRRGIDNPRPLMAIGSAVITVAMVLVEPPRAEDDKSPSPVDSGVEALERPQQ
jgi:hypothetical protein